MTLKSKKHNTIFAENYGTHLATGVFLAVIALLFTFPVGDGDFFWHVKTGQWIWEHQALPIHDPFSHTNKSVPLVSQDSLRTQFILSQYWLGQLVLFGIWSISGTAGMVVLRATIYIGVLVFLYRWLGRRMRGILPLLTIFSVGNVLSHYPNERPQIFAYIFLPFMLYLLEKIVERDDGFFARHAVTLLLVMLVWSNSHGSFILGILLIGLHLICYLLTTIKNRSAIKAKIVTILTGSIIIALLNPNGFDAFKVFFNMQDKYKSQVAEYISPLIMALQHNVIDYGYWLLAAITLIIIIVKYKIIVLRHGLIILALLALSLTGTRYIPFFVLATPLILQYLPDWKPVGKFAFLPLLAIVIWGFNADYRNILKFREERSFPSQAIEFLNNVRPPGNLFNYIDWGGYLMCQTEYPVFVDGRGLMTDLVLTQTTVLNGINWEQTLNTYNVKTMIVPGTNLISKQVYPLLLKIRQNENWSLIYQDEVALVFLQKNSVSEAFLDKYTLPKNKITEHIMARWKWQNTGDL